MVKKQTESALALSVLLSTPSIRHHSGQNVVDSRGACCGRATSHRDSSCFGARAIEAELYFVSTVLTVQLLIVNT